MPNPGSATRWPRLMARVSSSRITFSRSRAAVLLIARRVASSASISDFCICLPVHAKGGDCIPEGEPAKPRRLIDRSAANQPHPHGTALEFAVAQLGQGGLHCTALHRHIGAVVEHLDLAHLIAGDAVVAGEGAENVAGADFLFLATVDLQGGHGRFG